MSDNIRHFAGMINDETGDVGVDLLTCDGGFAVDGDENFQEELLRQLVLDQFLMGLMVIRQGGAFVCKIFDAFTPVTVALLYILYREFDRISIVKPYTSRPANSERYAARSRAVAWDNESAGQWRSANAWAPWVRAATAMW